MSFKLGDIIVDRIQYGVAEDFDGNILYALTQLSEATIDISAESEEATDRDGTLIKKFWRAKSGTFTATNALINLPIIGAANGTDPEYASEDNAIEMPKIITVNSGSTVTLTDYVSGTVTVNALSSNGGTGTAYTLSTEASATEFGLSAEGVLTPPTDENETRYIVKYQRSVTSGAVLMNKSDEFPDTVKLTLKALIVDPCSVDTLRACYIVMPSFQPSPEVSIDLTTDATQEYTGDLQVDYCSDDKVLYYIYIAEDDEE